MSPKGQLKYVMKTSLADNGETQQEPTNYGRKLLSSFLKKTSVMLICFMCGQL